MEKEERKYAVGIDISKNKSTISIIDNYGEVIEKPFEIQHTKGGLNILLSKLEILPKENIKILMEATGHYHYSISKALVKENYFVCVENALVIKKFNDMDL